MKRRHFLKLTAAGTASFAVQALCGQNIRTLIPSLTAGPIVSSPGITPTVTTLLPGATPTLATMPAPQRKLGSNSNYFLYSDCKPVTGLSVTIDITKDIVSDVGVSFQLNAWSPQGANCGWQQYFLSFETQGNSPLKAYAWVDNWPSASFKQSQNFDPGGLGDMINHAKLMLTLPGDTLPAGYKLTISLKYDNNENVNVATFTILDNTGKSTDLDMDLESLNYSHTVGGKASPVTSAALAPINSFMLVLVGSKNGKHSYISSGAGTLTYTASSPLKISSNIPRCTSAQTTGTAESANSVYGALPAGSSQAITQSFDTEVPRTYAPGIPFAVSRQFGLNQTDLFAVDGFGQLGVFSVLESGRWQLSNPLGPANLARPNAKLAASQHFGVNDQTDVFLIDQDGYLEVFWVVGSGDWDGPRKVGSKNVGHTAAAVVASQRFGVNNRTDAFLVDNQGQLNMFWSIGSGEWQGPEPVGAKGLADRSAALAVSQRFGVNDQTDVFVVGTNGQLNVFSAIGSGQWNGPHTIGPAGLARSGAALAISQRFGINDQTDVYVVDKNGQLNVFSAVGSGKWKGLQTIGPAGLADSGAALAVSQHFGIDDQTDVFVIDKKGQLNVFSVHSHGQWSDPVTLSPQGSAPSGAQLAVSQQFGDTDQTDVFFFDQTGIQAGSNGQGWPALCWANGINPWNGPKELVNDL